MSDSLANRVLRKIGVETAEPTYSRLESLAPSVNRKNGQWPKMLRKRNLVFATCMTAVLITCTLSWYPPLQTTYSSIKPSSDPLHPLRANLHVLIPASKSDPNLCKAIVSSRVLGYPTPTVINWDQTFDDPAFVDGGSHLAKINGTAQYLSSLDETHDDDLVLMLDGYDAWMQLRPQALVDRFFNINLRADKRIATSFDNNTVAQASVRQTIIFGAQKRCWPWSATDPPCYAVPQSSLPSDIYGPQTDTDVENEENPYIKHRQRYLNSGVAMGRVGAMRRLFDQALTQAPEEANFGSDQYIFSHIFGDQELYREMLRRDAGLEPTAGLNEGHIEEVRAKAAARQDGSFEFGIGLDYGSEIGLNTVFAEEDTEWIRFADRDLVHEVQNDRGISRESRRLDVVADDINSTAPPFQTISPHTLPGRMRWRDVSLFTNVWTGISPVVIHHNAHHNGMKILRETWWPKIWFQTRLRELLDASGLGPHGYVAIGKADGREYWPEEVWSGGNGKTNAHVAKDARSGRWLAYPDICGAYDGEVFRDGRGWD